MGRLLSPTRSRIRTVLSSIQSVTAGRWWYKVGFSLLGISLIAAARFDSVSEARAAIRHYATHARAALLMTASDTTVVFGPKQFVTAKSNPKGNPQINFVESFSVPSATATSVTTTEYIIRLQHVGGNLTTATVAVNGTPVAVAADFVSATIIERPITLTQTAPNTNSLTLSLKGAEAAGLVVTILGTPNTSVDVFGPKVYEKTAKPKGHEKPDDPKGHEKPDDPKGHEEPGTNPAHFVDSFTLRSGAVAPYRISATASAPGARANITLNGVKVIADGDFGTTTPDITTPVIRDANLVSGNNTLVVDVHGPTGTTITVEVTATDKGAPVLTIASPQPAPDLVTNATTVSVTGTSEDTGPTTVKVNGVAATMSGAGNTQFSAIIPLKEGTNAIAIVAKDQAGNHTDSARTVTRDTRAPTLTLKSPDDDSYTNQDTVTVSGTVSDGTGAGATAVTVKVNEVSFPVAQGGAFSGSYQLTPGTNFVTVTATDAGGNATSQARKVTQAKEPPALAVTTPEVGFVKNTTLLAVSGTVTGTTPITVTVNGTAMTVTNGGFSGSFALTEGPNDLAFTATDGAGNQTVVHRMGMLDTQAPVLKVTSPADNLVTKTSTVQLAGTVVDASSVTVSVSVNSVPVIVDATAGLTGSITLREGENLLTIAATDRAGNSTSQVRRVTLDTQGPVLTVNEPADGLSVTSETIVVSGTVTDSTAVTVTVNGNPIEVAGGGFSTTVPLPSKGANAITVVATDAASNQSTVSRSVTRTVATPPGNGSSDALPADPLVHAPPVQASIATTPFAAGAFLYSGANPLQTGVAAGTIELRRAAVLRGRVLGRDGAPIAGVEITVLDHPELGRTETRASGQYDLAVNGGGNLLLRYVKDGLLPVLRGADAPWQDYVVLDDVILLGLDAQVTAVDLTGGTPEMQVARGTAQTDADGTRQATLMFPEGTTATMVLPDGSTEPLSSLHVRATEYTVGENGHRMMPAPLPATSGYTYAAELTVDEARAAGATSVRFSQPVPFYVENFLGFPVGLAVPFGVLDHARGVWVPEENGVIIGIVGKTGALADVDTNGDGTADDQATLLALGIGDDERSRLAAVYETGQTLWRIPLTHFSTIDANWPAIVKGKAPKVKLKPKDTQPRTVCVKEQRSTIECQTQVLGERIGLVGTPFALHYRSDRAPGRTLANSIEIPLTDATIPDGLRGVVVTVEVAGREFVDTFPPEPNMKHTFVWDGIDAWGRRVQGGQPVTVAIGYAYDQFYAVPANEARNFGLVCRGDSTYVQPGVGLALACIIPAPVGSNARSVGFVEQVIHTRIATFSPGAAGLGGWTLDGHDAYDPMARELYTGDGGRRRAGATSAVITRVAGGGEWTPGAGDGGPATAAFLEEVSGLATGPDGVLYIADASHGSVRSVGSDGTIRTVASEVLLPLQRMGPRTNRRDMVVDPSGRIYVITSPTAVYRLTPGVEQRELIAGVPDSICYDCSTQVDRPNRDKYGVLMTVASSKIHGPSNVEGPLYEQDAVAVAPDLPTRVASLELTRSGIVATDLRFVRLSGISLGPDGVLYLADVGTGYVWRVGVDGIATIFAGGGSGGPGVDAEGILAARATFHDLSGVAAAADGNVYIADGALIRKVRPDGTVTTVAGNVDGRTGADGDMGTNQLLASINGVTVGRDGGVYFSTGGEYFSTVDRRIYLLRTDGRMVLVAGSITEYDYSDEMGELATQVHLSDIGGIAVGPDGTVYVAQFWGGVLAISPPLAGVGRSEIAIAAEDGSSLEIFNVDGLHLRTIDALTGVVLLRFGYDSGNQLTTVTDANNNVTTIVRDELGNPIAIVGPFGQRSDFTLDADGLLSRVTNPAGEAVGLTYRSGGLLATVTDPLGRVSRFTYDSTGLLVRDQDPAGGALDLARTEFDGGWEVSQTSTLGQRTTYRVESTLSGGEVRVNTNPAGLVGQTSDGTDGSSLTVAPDGTTTSLIRGPDPRFGMQAPILKEMTATTLGGLVAKVNTSRSSGLSDPQDPFSPLSQSESIVINDAWEWDNSYDASTRTLTALTPEGRSSTTRLDSLGRVVEEATPGITPFQYQYDVRGRVAQVAQGLRQTTYTYDGGGRQASKTDALGRTEHYFYDAGDRLTRQVLADGHEVLYAYDANGNLRSLIPPGRPAHQFQYNSVNLLTSYAPPSLGSGTWSTAYQFDLDRKLTQVTRPDGQTIGFAYDATGRQSTITTPGGVVNYSYHAGSGNLSGVSGPYGESLSFSYDGLLLSGASWTGEVAGAVTATYNSDFRVSGLSVNGTAPIGFGYDGDGMLTQAGSEAIARNDSDGLITGTSLGVVVTSESYTSLGALSQHTARVNAGAVFDVAYNRDAVGRINSLTETLDGTSTSKGYSYDLAGRLTEVRENGALTAVYEYEANGNRVAATRPGGVERGTYDDQDRLLTYGSASYTYSRNGELSAKTVGSEVTRYSYDVLGNLLRVVLPDGMVIEYVIDAMNRRVGKKVNGLLVQGFLYQGQLNPVAELDGAGNVTSQFVYGTRANIPDYIIKAGVSYSIIADGLGSVRLVVRTTDGVVTQRLAYDEFGRELMNTNQGFQPFGYAGGLADGHTGLVRFGARDYDPSAGRWTAKDPSGLSGGLGLYTYVGNNPVNYTDPSGLCVDKSGNWRPCTVNWDPQARNHNVEPRVLDYVQEIADAADVDLTLSSGRRAEGSDCSQSRHDCGLAVDINRVNGRIIGDRNTGIINAAALDFIRAVQGIALGCASVRENFGPMGMWKSPAFGAPQEFWGGVFTFSGENANSMSNGAYFANQGAISLWGPHQDHIHLSFY